MRGEHLPERCQYIGEPTQRNSGRREQTGTAILHNVVGLGRNHSRTLLCLFTRVRRTGLRPLKSHLRLRASRLEYMRFEAWAAGRL
ncbi:hypothetical protein GCM10011588_46460 [Nocardia jinanensis]|uniref:Uncharacterized protein n=1 Tax=Nocardia jinanensis TaxID=382504 RepID=A0A917VX59_9NOCA|nr:hypothetical protein GCM10011588_46460 [Nocardia jinanensis]